MKFDQKELFLYETYSRVEGVVGTDRATQVYSELSEHIDQLQEEYQSRGLHVELAKRAALSAMGTPKLIAREFARHSISRPWRLWPLWIVVFGIMCYWALRTSQPLLLGAPAMLVLAPFLFFEGFRNRTAFPLKGMLALAAVLFLGLSFVESRSIRFWSIQMPYSQAHERYLTMRHQHAEFLKVESKLAREFESVKKTLLTQQPYLHTYPTDTDESVRLSFLKYEYANGWATTGQQTRANVFSHVPVSASKSYPLRAANKAIDEKLAAMQYFQTQRRNQMTWLGILLNTSSVQRAVQGVPYVVFSLGLVLGNAFWLSLLGAKVGIAAVTRRRRILI